MPTLNWIGKDAVANHHLQVPFHLLRDVPELACGEPGSGNLIVERDKLVALKATSFRLQTASDWFYPDFVCQLRDGRSLLVAYKGKDRYTTTDAEEKRAVGAVWESRTNGRCLFVMPTGGDFSAITQRIVNG
jgi:hypothetical protein